MSIIAAKKLHEALAKALNVGLVEEAFTIEDCELVFRNLRPDEYAAAIQDCDGLDGPEYMNAYQRAHISRAIIEVNGADLRGVKYVTVEEEDPKTHQPKKVNLELHLYLIDHMLNSWGKEAIYTAFRKFGDVVELAERKAKEGVTFIIPDETPEERYRRLLLEAKEVEGSIPGTMVDSILEEIGFIRKASPEELQRVTEKTAQLARELGTAAQAEDQPDAEPEMQPEDEPEEHQEVAPAPRASRTLPVDPHATLQQAIANRRAPEAQHSPSPQSAAQPPADPEPPVAPSRAAQTAALEADAFSMHPEAAHEVVEIRQHLPIDPKAAAAILDQPPAAGINPKFRAPTRI